jgi:hypothetical protein
MRPKAALHQELDPGLTTMEDGNGRFYTSCETGTSNIPVGRTMQEQKSARRGDDMVRRSRTRFPSSPPSPGGRRSEMDSRFCKKNEQKFIAATIAAPTELLRLPETAPAFPVFPPSMAVTAFLAMTR